MKKPKLAKALMLSGVFMALGIVYLPIMILIIFSFNYGVVGQWNSGSLNNYRELFSSGVIWQALGNTLLIAVIAALLATVIGTLTALGIHYMKRKSRRSFITTNRVMMILPPVAMALALRLFFVATGFRQFGFATLIVSHAMITIPFVILTVMPRLSHLNANVYDAGQDLGANNARTLFTVILPQVIPAMIAGFAIAFVLSIDEFIITILNNGAGSGIQTLSIYLHAAIARQSVPPVVLSMSSFIFIISFIVLIAVNILQTRRLKKLNRSMVITSLAK